MVIYGIENIENGKLYVGQSRNKLNKRVNEHKRFLRYGTHVNNYLQNSWDKYGEKNFRFFILEKDFDNLEDLNDAERFWINVLNTLHRDHGYNLKSGGGNGKIIDEEYLNSISLNVYQYEYPTGIFINGYESSKEASRKNKIDCKTIQKCCRGELVTYNGFYWSYEKLERYEFDKNKYTPVYQFTLDGEFIREWDNATKPNKDLNIDRSNILKCCNGTYSQSGGFIWKFKYNDDGCEISKDINMKRNLSKRKRKELYQFDLDGKFIREWESAGSVERELGIARSNITNVCKGKKYNKTAGGFIWRYKYSGDGILNKKKI